jgi:hypothetical protein
MVSTRLDQENVIHRSLPTSAVGKLSKKAVEAFLGVVGDVERGRLQATLIAWRNAFAAAGVMFLDDDEGYGAGVRFRKSRKS